ncbi:MAG: hypothetical protein SF182_11315 [Deltaproteobacteria bacterium]|nr:hypothetical protein [Deltaproteobacteria bacterium]
MPDEVPTWCRWRVGGGPLLLVAPHGGRRDAARRRGAKVNDLHTAELAVELADRLDASLIVNPSLDRNTLDLNRVGQVHARAPWFIALLQRLLSEILARHRRAEVLFVHGWNTGQAKCDIGIGQRLPDGALHGAPLAGLTASPAYIAARLATLRRACAAAGIAAPFGERYPARHPNNVVQLFRRGGHAATPPAIAAWLADDRVDAVQLELGVPLRWPGWGRRAFIDALCQAFAAHPTAAAVAARPPVRRVRGDALPAPVALQCYDPAAGLGCTARIDPTASGGVASRLLLFRGGREVALFTGEDATPSGSGAGPHFRSRGDGFHVDFDGALLLTDDGDRYLDLEAAFAASRLVDARVDLRFAPGARADYGRVQGAIAIDGVAYAIDTLGFARPAALQRGADAWHSQITLHAAFDATRAWRLRHQVPGSSQLLALDGSAAPIRALSVCFDGRPSAPRHIRIDDGDSGLLAEPLGRVTIARPLADGRAARISFGVARFTRGGDTGWGFYEYARAATSDEW